MILCVLHDLPCSSTRVEGGELFDRVVDVGKFSEPTAKLLFYQLLLAVKVSQWSCMFHPNQPSFCLCFNSSIYMIKASLTET